MNQDSVKFILYYIRVYIYYLKKGIVLMSLDISVRFSVLRWNLTRTCWKSHLSRFVRTHTDFHDYFDIKPKYVTGIFTDLKITRATECCVCAIKSFRFECCVPVDDNLADLIVVTFFLPWSNSINSITLERSFITFETSKCEFRNPFHINNDILPEKE